MSTTVAILAGGTGGHIFPGLAVAEALRDRSISVVWLGAEAGMETRLVPQAGIELHTIKVSGLRGKGLTALLAAPFRLLRAVWQALAVLRRLEPDAVIGFGGFAAGPGALAARLLAVPVLIHEQNRVPGLTNRLLAHLARRVLCGFPDAFPAGNGEWLGNPVRSAIAALPAPAQRFAGRTGPVRILVLGGSQGARALNHGVPLTLATRFGRTDLVVRHQCGRGSEDAVRAAYAGTGVVAEPTAFIDDMACAYAWADLVICRAGALTLAELCAAGVAAVLVPFPAAVDDHQTRNAEFSVEHGAAVLVSEGEHFETRLGESLAPLLADPDRRLAMAEAARRLARIDAAERVADAVLAEVDA